MPWTKDPPTPKRFKVTVFDEQQEREEHFAGNFILLALVKNDSSEYLRTLCDMRITKVETAKNFCSVVLELYLELAVPLALATQDLKSMAALTLLKQLQEKPE